MKRLVAAALLLSSCLMAQAIRQNAGFKANTVPRNDDGSGPLTSLGFTLNFFGKMRSAGWVNNNGNITFDSPLSTYTPFGLESTQREIVAAFFADVDTRPEGSALVSYGADTINGRPAFGANYVNVGYYQVHADKLNRFQIVLIERSDTGDGNFDIEFNYERISWETGDASGGVNGFGGVPASVGWSNGSGAPGTSYELEGSFISGSFLDPGRNSLTRGRMNSTIPGRWVFRARGGQIQQPLTLSTGCPLPNAAVANPYLQRLIATGATGSYRWSMIADPGATLPPGLTLSTDGTLSGTPTVVGTTEFSLRVTSTTEDGEQVASRRCSLTVTPPVLTISSACPLPNATVGQQYSRVLAVSGGRPPYRWLLAQGSTPLPAGLALAESGAVSGMPTEAGTRIVTLQVTSNEADGAQPAVKTCSLTVNPSMLNLNSSCLLPAATLGVPYAQELTVSGGVAPYTWSAAGGLPSGLSLSAAGLLEGVPTVPGAGAFRTRVIDSRGSVVEQTCSLSVQNPILSIDTACPLPSGFTGQPYSQTLRVSGGSSPYSWSVAGSLPAGLTLSAGGVLRGNPASAGGHGFRLLVADSEGRMAARGCNLTISRADYSLTSCPMPHATVGVDYSQRLVVEGGTEPYFFGVTGALPAGLVLTSSGLMTGRAREAGTFPVNVKVLDSSGRTTEQPCPITVRPSAVEIVGQCPLPKATVGQPYLERFTAAGGAAPYRFRLTGQLPAGVELSQEGVVRGTPVAPARQSFEVEAVDGQNRRVSKSCSLEVALPALPSLRLSGVASTIPAASPGPAITLELAQSYSLPVKGELVLDVEADTGIQDSRINRSDPTVRFTNGQRIFPFQVPAGGRSVSTSIATTGTVASLITARVDNLQVAGIPLPAAAPLPRQFRVPRSAPVLSEACFVPAEEGINAVITGSSTTRQIQTASFDYTLSGVGLPPGQQNKTVDVSGISYEYFANDESVRTGGAFSLTIALQLNPANVSGISVVIGNSVGLSQPRTMQRCR